MTEKSRAETEGDKIPGPDFRNFISMANHIIAMYNCANDWTSEQRRKYSGQYDVIAKLGQWYAINSIAHNIDIIAQIVKKFGGKIGPIPVIPPGIFTIPGKR